MSVPNFVPCAGVPGKMAKSRKLGGAAALTFVLAISAAASQPARADRLDCTGYPEKREFVDAQSWWMQMPGQSGTDFGHLHIGGCIPEREQQKTAIELDVRVVMHDNPGKVAAAVLVTKTPTSEVTRIHDKSIAGMTCPTGTCTAWLHWKVPLSWFGNSGLQEIRYRVYVDEPDGNRMISSLNYQTYIKNGQVRDDVTRMAYLRAKGWYTGAGYCEASLREPVPDAAVTTFYAPVVAMVNHGTPDDLPVTHSIVLRDADFHMDIPGDTIAEAAGSYGPASVAAGEGAAAGAHRLIVKSDCDDPRGSTNSGLLVFPFKIN